MPPYRSTLVVVCPECEDIESFDTFNSIIETINESRRRARTFNVGGVADKMADAIAAELKSDNTVEWHTSVNLAHLHPAFDEIMDQEDPATTISAEDDEAAIEHKNKIRAYKQKKMKARRSPHPTIVLEVRSSRPSQGVQGTMEGASPEQISQAKADRADRLQQNKPSPEAAENPSLAALESAFMRAAVPQNEKPDCEVPSSTKTTDLADLARRSVMTPLQKAKNWHREKCDGQDLRANPSSFREFDGKKVDEAYQFVFSMLASEMAQFTDAKSASDQRTLVVSMPKFLPASATSFTKFRHDVVKLFESSKIDATAMAYHPEEVDEANRAPMSILVISVARPQV